MLFKRNAAKSSKPQPDRDYAVKISPIDEFKERLDLWLKEQTTLIEALAVAVTFHVLGFPLMWFIGWALPWPGSPVIVTVIELNLENWPREAKTEKVTDIMKSKMHKYDK